AAGRPASPASDRYALAVVAYELLTGTRPFAAESAAALAHAHVHAPPPPPSQRAPGLPPGADRALLRGLDKDPARRWPEAGAMVDALAGSLAGPQDEATAATALLAGAGAPTAATKPLTGARLAP